MSTNPFDAISTNVSNAVSINQVSNSIRFISLYQSLAINGFIVVIGLVIFVLVWNNKKIRSLWQTRVHKADELQAPTDPDHLPRGRWLIKIMTMSDKELLAMVGLDAVLFIRLLHTAMKFFFLMALVSCAVLLPVNVFVDPIVKKTKIFYFVDFTIINVRDASNALWIHVGIAYVSAALMIVLWRHESLHFGRLARHFHLVANTSVRLDRVPRCLRSREALTDFLTGRVGGGEVRFVSFVHRSNKLRLAVERREILDDSGDDTTAIDAQITALRQSLVPSKIAYVTFRSGASALKLINTERLHLNGMTAKRASDPRDIDWENVVKRASKKKGEIPHTVNATTRQSFTAFIVFILVIFWMVPLSFINMLTSLDNLEYYVPWLKNFLDNHTGIQSILQGVLPAYSFMILLLITPRIIEQLVKRFEMRDSKSAAERSVTNKFYVVLIVDFFCYSIISKGILVTLNEATTSWRYIPIIIASALPNQSTSFLIYLISFTCFTLPFVDLLQFPACLFRLCSLRRRSARNAPVKVVSAGRFAYADYYPYQLLHILVGCTYIQIAPLVIPFVALYFAIAAVIYRVQLCYVYERQFESGGQFFRSMLARSFGSGMAGMVILASVLYSKNAFMQATALFPAVIALGVANVVIKGQVQRIIDRIPRRESATIEPLEQGRPEYSPDWE